MKSVIGDNNSRVESDEIGSISLNDDILYGINTYRALENFPTIAPLNKYPEFVRALAICKKAAALSNQIQGHLSSDIADAIVKACDQMYEQKLNPYLLVDIFEGSGGTSTNMNVNEVLANKALAVSGYRPGQYEIIHPNDHVNLSQSTNDVYPSALSLAVAELLPPLIKELGKLKNSLLIKAEQFKDIVCLGRTCLQDAQPMYLGQRFNAYASVLTRLIKNIDELVPGFYVLSLGGTAIGTGFGSTDGYKGILYKQLSKIVGKEVSAAEDSFDAMQNLDHYAQLSGYMTLLANAMEKCAEDLMLMSSGPDGGFNEIRLPIVQAGSSIMPGKVNPVIPMAVCQCSYLITGNDVIINRASARGMLEINHYEPLVSTKLFESISVLKQTAKIFNDKCIANLSANKDECNKNVLNSMAIATGIRPVVGYENAADLVRQALSSNSRLIDILDEKNIMTKDETIKLINAVSTPVN